MWQWVRDCGGLKGVSHAPAADIDPRLEADIEVKEGALKPILIPEREPGHQNNLTDMPPSTILGPPVTKLERSGRRERHLSALPRAGHALHRMRVGNKAQPLGIALSAHSKLVERCRAREA
jgi:hypothetical protein